MRTVSVLLFVVALTGCSQLSPLGSNEVCRGSLMNDCFNKKEKNLAENKPNLDGQWGLVFIHAKSLQASLARRKALARGCTRAARRYHNESVLIDKVGQGKYRHSGCKLITTDIYPEQMGEATLYRIDAWVGIPVGEAARAWLQSVTH
jgi:hypothetical protein